MWLSNSTCDPNSSEVILFGESKKRTHLGPLFAVLSQFDGSTNLVQGEWL